MLSGKVADARAYIGNLAEGLMGTASPQDLETMFQLIYLTFVAPRADVNTFEVIKTQRKEMVKNRSSSPMVVFSDTLSSLLSRDHPRAQPLTLEKIEKMDLEKSLAFYQDRFAEAGDFIFFFVGNIDFETMEPLVTRYLGSLPTIGRKETWKNVGVGTPKGVIKKTIFKGLEPQSQVAIVFTGPFEYTQRNRTALRGMTMAFQTRLREKLREELGGTLRCRSQRQLFQDPGGGIQPRDQFGIPARVEEMITAVFAEIKNIQTQGLSVKEVQDIKETFVREYEIQSKQILGNLSQLEHKYRLSEDPRGILSYEDTLQNLSPDILKRAAKLYLNTDNYVQVVLMPEKTSKKKPGNLTSSDGKRVSERGEKQR